MKEKITLKSCFPLINIFNLGKSISKIAIMENSIHRNLATPHIKKTTNKFKRADRNNQTNYFKKIGKGKAKLARLSTKMRVLASF